MNVEWDQWYFLNIGIMLPSIAAFFYVLPYGYTSIDYYIFVPLALLPVVKRLVPKYTSPYVYNVAGIIVLPIILATLLNIYGFFTGIPLLSGIYIPLNSVTFFTFEMDIVLVSIVEGSLARRPNQAVGAMVGTFALLLEYVAATLVTSYQYYPNVSSALSAQMTAIGFSPMTPFLLSFYVADMLEAFAIYGLFIHGGLSPVSVLGTSISIPFPLNSISGPVDLLLLGTLMASVIFMVVRYYVGGESDYEVRLQELFLSLTIGSIAAIAVIVIMNLSGYAGFQFTLLMFFVLALIMATLITSRRRHPKPTGRENNT